MSEAEGKRLKLTPAQTKQRERSYQIGLALAGCGGGAVLTGTAFAKMSEKGKKEREQELQLAAADAMPRTYKDPDNPTLLGRITPQPSYVESDKECRTIEDNLADEGKGETAYLKYCKQPDGKWAQETSAKSTAAGAGH
jgi:surface antigen